MSVDEEQNTDQPRKGLRFERSISVGNVLTMVGALAPMVLWGAQMHSDMQAIKAELPRIEQRQKEADGKQDQASAETKREIKEELREINRKLDRLIETRGVKRDGT
jgi:hypothetical protein